tara:strand:+ start:1403 stop:1624 length:222 start_codon:yes stop_codon:yes gene_type:complete
MPEIKEEDKMIVFSIGDSTKKEHYADVAIPFATFEELSEEELHKWLNSIARSCPTVIANSNDEFAQNLVQLNK